MDFGIAMKRK